MVQISDLKKLDIVIPSKEEAENLLEEFEAEVALSEQIEKIEEQRKQLASTQWNLSK